MSKEVFIKMREEEYFQIPQEFRERYLTSKNVSVETNDWSLNMEDECYSRLYKAYRSAKKDLSEREYQLREQRRKR